MTIDPAHEADRGGALAGDGGGPIIDHGETTCRPRERASAVLGMVAALILLLAIVAAALLAAGGGLGGGGAGTRTAGAGIGSGRGSGIGAGNGTGSGDHGHGPGAGTDGDGRMAGAPGEASQPPGNPEGDAPVGLDEPSESVAEGAPGIEPPKFGFTAPDDPAPVVPPRSASAPGVPQGRPAGGASGARGGGGSEFMGVRSAGRHVVYVIDYSGSMGGDRFAHTRLELKRSIERLPADGSFLVIFFDNEFTVMPPGRLVPATARNRHDAVAWIDAQQVRGGTDPTRALEYALSLHPETIFLMTDGQFADQQATHDAVERANAERRTSINTIAFHERSAEPELRRIAKENRGDYRYVPPPGMASPP